MWNPSSFIRWQEQSRKQYYQEAMWEVIAYFERECQEIPPEIEWISFNIRRSHRDDF